LETISSIRFMQIWNPFGFMPAFTLFISVIIDFLPNGFPSLSIIGYGQRDPAVH
jgi:hypothetical protein